MKETLEIQVIIGRKTNLKNLDLRYLIDQEVSSLYRDTSLILDL